MTRPQAKKSGNNTALLLGTVVAAALIVLALFAGRGNDTTAPEQLTEANFNLSNKPMLGSADAPVQMTIVEDFKCPACKTFDENTLSKLKAEYIDTGKVQAHFVLYPFLAELAQLPEDDSKYAAQAAECVYKNDGSDAFYQYKNIIFRAQGAESDVWASKERLKELAANVGSIDQGNFATCLDSDETAGLVDDNEKEVIENNITSTPTVLINGENIPNTYDNVKAAIEEALAAQ